MVADESRNELTSTLHLGSRDESLSSQKSKSNLDDLLSSLSPEEKEVIAQIQSSQGEKAMLIIARGANKGSRFLITSEGATIGRSQSSSVFLDDVTVSRKHAKIIKVDGTFVLKDEGSLNGTYINNISVSQHDLSSGDEFQIGKFHLTFVS